MCFSLVFFLGCLPTQAHARVYGLLGVNAYISLVLSSPFHARAQECSTALLQRRDQMHACLPRLRCTRGLCLASGDAMPCPSAGPSTLRHQSLRKIPASLFLYFSLRSFVVMSTCSSGPGTLARIHRTAGAAPRYAGR